MTGDRVAEIRTRLEAANPKDWRRHDFGHPGDEEPTSIVIHEGKFDWQAVSEGEFIAMVPDADSTEDRNALLIANAPADLAYLLAELESARAKLAAVEALADRLEAPAPDDPSIYGMASNSAGREIRAALATGGDHV